MAQEITLQNLAQFTPTPDEFNAVLVANTHAEVKFKTLRQYIYKYGLPQLRRMLPVDDVYENYNTYIDEIYKQVKLYVIEFPDNVYLLKKLSNSAVTALSNLHHWRGLATAQKKKLCAKILLRPGDDYCPSQFVDINIFGSPSREDNESCFATNTIFGAKGIGLGSVFNKLTLEEVAQVCIEHIGRLEPGASREFDDFKNELNILVEKRIAANRLRNEKRITNIIQRATLAILLKRIRQNLVLTKLASNTAKPAKRERLSNAQLPDIVLDALLLSYVSPKAVALIQDAPAKHQPALLKLCMIKGAASNYNIGIIFERLFRDSYLPPFLIDVPQLRKQLDTKIRSQLQLSPKDLDYLSIKSVEFIKRLPDLSHADRTMLENITKNRQQNMLTIREFPLNTITDDNHVAKLYLAGTDAGVTRARLRSLFKGLYVRYLPDEFNVSHAPPIAHDILTRHEHSLFHLFRGWSKLPRHAQPINKIVDCLVSQLGGAQGNTANAFNNWNMLPTLSGHEDVFAIHQPANLNECIYLSQNNPALVASIDAKLRAVSTYGIEPEQLRQFASGIVTFNDLDSYLTTISKIKGVAKVPNAAIKVPISGVCQTLTVEVLPWDNLIGNLGVGVSGVCIDFNGLHHLEHRTPAVANLIVRSDTRILLWGLLIRLQNDTEVPTYLLNNLQGGLPSTYAKFKTEVKGTIIDVLAQLGDVYTQTHYFNAMQVVDTKKLRRSEAHDIVLPKMRLDVAKEPFTPEDDERFANGSYIKVLGELYLLKCKNPKSTRLLHGKF